MAAKTSTTLRVFPPVSFNFKVFTLWFFLKGSDEEVEKAEIKEMTIKSCGSSETPSALPSYYIHIKKRFYFFNYFFLESIISINLICFKAFT